MKDELGRFIDFLNSIGEDEARRLFWQSVRSFGCDVERVRDYLLRLEKKPTLAWRLAVTWDQRVRKPHADFPGYAEWLRRAER